MDNSSQGRILVIEDEEQVRELVVRSLRRAGYTAEPVGDGQSARRALGDDGFDLVLLDLRLPDVDGLDLLTELRERSHLPVIIITGRGSEGDRVMGLTSGADDYVVKPFSFRELVARVEAVLRRAGGRQPDRRLTFEGLEIDLDAREVLVSGELVPTTPKEFDLLAFLARHPRRAFSRSELLRDVWGSEHQDPATVTEHVRRLRLKLTPGEPERWIATVRGVGYRFEP